MRENSLTEESYLKSQKQCNFLVVLLNDETLEIWKKILASTTVRKSQSWRTKPSNQCSSQTNIFDILILSVSRWIFTSPHPKTVNEMPKKERKIGGR